MRKKQQKLDFCDTDFWVKKIRNKRVLFSLLKIQFELSDSHFLKFKSLNQIQIIYYTFLSYTWYFLNMVCAKAILVDILKDKTKLKISQIFK
jgi:hypothetical protein